ncbi:cold shock domain-containing protein CG9705-like [Lingula anatina]|uniref:Cold shock domain-containing protein CG9705 n=1 Tax=Lingula anatina TaxID=7574 RepID=A0A1S3HBJ0_LINAN|nr:cold shock domain-containing protein CG9705 [Lingula anatina]XP_013383374.1 cold shock domain-containing protein CG9705 [Lingula anatina]XP_013383376.1 cold shock domain-containing protein CG9705 [Lingula anatina]XP_013383377.1 cold shock domain-containing protein CG9705 [Lingula anatina]XP_013420968.1 cold shock domain-containing protein CG9705-like [Lingula anatina]XP_013420970.1 cold shock domain-containing protein CG9705-like [Lingula anatina]XP_013420971.1 cold shock domain-containing|eukprot:XP_013383373.1 cold shock domain-containing protein CG9705 [Lingula anatina]
MQSPKDIPQKHSVNDSPGGHHPGSPVQHGHFLIPSPIITRRMRTNSVSERAKQGPVLKGKVKSFCRTKGHGFIIPAAGGEPLFVHISDIEEEYVPKEGDEVTYQVVHVPPKNEKFQAVHVHITNLVQGVTHEKWDTPPASPQTSPNK